jgi:DNA-binding MarR family transcriptional regulator
LIYLSRVDGLTQTELADSLDVERISAGRMVDRLVESGLVERRADPSDRRVWRLHLLPAAHGIVSELTSIGEQVEAETLSVLTTDQQVLFLNLLEALNTGLKRPKVCTDYKKEVE